MNRALVVVVAAISGIVASGCGGSSPGALTIITVSGVVTTADGPVANAKVKINDRPVVTTASNGTFTVTEVTVPYDALVGNAAKNSAVLYQKLARSDPDLNFGDFGTVPPVRNATITGKVTAATGNFAAGTVTIISFGSADFNVPLSNSSTFAPVSALSSVDYTLPVVWRGDSPIDGTVYALQWNYDATSKLPTAFTWHGSQPATVNVGETSSIPDVNMETLSANSHVSGSVTVPDGYTVTSRWYEIYLEPDHGRVPVFCELNATPPDPTLCKINSPISLAFDFVVPSITGATATVWVNAVNGAAVSQVRQCGILPGSSGVNPTVPLPPKPDQPDDSATQIGPGQTFSWTAFPVSGGIHALFVSTSTAVAAGEVKSFIAYTAGTQMPLPDLAPVGLSWPAAIAYTWAVIGYAPLTMDTWADPIIQSGCDFKDAISASRTFTTKP